MKKAIHVFIWIVAAVIICSVVNTFICNPPTNTHKAQIDSLSAENNKLRSQIIFNQQAYDSIEEENEYLLATRIKPRIQYVQKIDSTVSAIPADSLSRLWASLSKRYFDTCGGTPCTDTVYSSINRVLTEKNAGR